MTSVLEKDRLAIFFSIYYGISVVSLGFSLTESRESRQRQKASFWKKQNCFARKMGVAHV